MPFFEHDDFRQVMKTLTLSGVAVYTKSLLTALAHVHDQGVIHRDVKPRNFMYNAKMGQGTRVKAAATAAAPGVCTGLLLMLIAFDREDIFYKRSS